jgi:hypothetical protein
MRPLHSDASVDFSGDAAASLCAHAWSVLTGVTQCGNKTKINDATDQLIMATDATVLCWLLCFHYKSNYR